METILFERDSELPGLVTVTLNRPEKLNAISQKMHRELQEVCTGLRDDFEARVVILTGAGRAFSAGADLGGATRSAVATVPSPATANVLQERANATIGNRTAAALEGVPQVTIAAINGLAVRGAVVFLVCTDIRLASESAWFSIPEVDLDIPMTWNSLPRFMREIGPARTKELVMTCDRFSAEDALRWGLLNHVVPDGNLLPRARELAAKLLAKDPMSLAMTKSTTAALAQAMVPTTVTHSDADYLVFARLLREERARRG